MEPYSVEQLVAEAKVAIDENVSSEELASLHDLDTLTLDEILESKIEDAARLVHDGAAHELLDGGEQIPLAESVGLSMVNLITKPEWLPEDARELPLPEDFLRLVVLQMSDWRTGVTDAVTEDNPAYMMQGSPYAGIRGNKQRPVVVYSHTAGGPVLNIYGTTAFSAYRALYIPRPTINEGSVKLCPKLERAVVYRLASMACAITGASDLAAILLGTSNELAGIVTG